MTLDRKEVGEEAAREHDDQTGVREMNPEFAPGPVKAFRMRRHEIDEQHRTDEMTAREDRDFEAATVRWPPDKQALKVTFLRLMNAQMNLGKRAREDEHHRGGKADHRQFQRREEIKQTVLHLVRI